MTAYTYYQNDFGDDTLLGGIPTPQEATMAKLASIDEKRLGFGATTDMFTTLVSQLVQSKIGIAETGELWVSGVTEKVLSWYDITDDAFFAYNQAQVANIKARNPGLSKSFILPHDHNRPFALVHAAYMGPFLGAAVDDELGQLSATAPKWYTNLDICGLYAGYPLRRDFTVNEKSGSIDVKQGGLTETFGFNSPIKSLNVNGYNNKKMQTVKATTQKDSHGLPMSAAAAAGASSTWGTYDHFFYEKCETGCTQNVTGVDLLDTIAGGLGSPVVGQLASDSAKYDGSSQQYLYRLGDGGATGVVTPIHQLIARGVENVIAFANYDNKLGSAAEWDVEANDFIEGVSMDNTTLLWFGVPTTEIKYGSMDYS